MTMNLEKLIKRFRVDRADGFKLSRFDPADTCGLDIGKSAAEDMIAGGLRHLATMQEKLYAQNRWALLIVLQGMDAAGKDGVVKHVMSGLNPQGCEVRAFKAPTAEELQHDFLWRAGKLLPARGRIGIFNRSYYEDVLVVRVRRELLAQQNLPPELATKKIWHERFKSIRAFEHHLVHNGTKVLKFHLRISRKNSAGACWRGSKTPPSAGSSPWPMSPTASRGASTWKPTRTRSATPRRRMRPGT